MSEKRNEKLCLVSDLQCHQEALNARRHELDLRLAKTSQDKDGAHVKACDLQRHCDVILNDINFAQESQQRLEDMKRLACELQEQKDQLNYNLMFSRELLHDAVREREANLHFFAFANQNLH